MLLIGTVDLAGHGRGRDPGDARAARRLPLVRQPALHGRAGPAARRAGSRSTSWASAALWFAISGVVVAIAVGSLGVAGPQPGDRLQGRDAGHVPTPQPQLVDDVRSRRTEHRLEADAVIQGAAPRPTASTRASRSGRSRSSRRPSDEAAARPETTRRRDALRVEERLVELRARRSRSSAIIAIIVSLLLIILYLAIRFDSSTRCR